MTLGMVIVMSRSRSDEEQRTVESNKSNRFRSMIMSDNELDELLAQLKETKKKSRHVPPNEAHIHNLLKRIDVFINRRQMKLAHHQKRLDDLQKDLIHSESESSKNRVELEKKDFEVHQLHRMLNQAEQTSLEMMKKYDEEVKKLSEQLCNVQHEYERLKLIHKQNRDTKSHDELFRLRELNKMLEIDNQRLYVENEQLKQDRSQKVAAQREETPLQEKLISLEKLVQSLQSSNSNLIAKQNENKLKIESLQNELEFYQRRVHQQEDLQHRSNSDGKSDEVEKLRALFSNSEQQCHILRLELQRVQAEKEMLKVQLIEAKFREKSTNETKNTDMIDYERSMRQELQMNIDQANQLINSRTNHKQSFEEKKNQSTHDISHQLYQCNESLLHAKRDMNHLKMELTDKNTTIYNLHRKIECLEQALMISKQRNKAQLKEIEDLRMRCEINSPSISQNDNPQPIMIDGLSTDDEGQPRSSMDFKMTLRTSSPIKSAQRPRAVRH